MMKQCKYLALAVITFAISGCSTGITGRKLQTMVWETTPVHSAYNDFFYIGSDPRGHHFRYIRMLAIDRSYRVPTSDALLVEEPFQKTQARDQWVHLSDAEAWKDFFQAEYPILYRIKKRIPDQATFWLLLFKGHPIDHLGIDVSNTEDEIRELVSIVYKDGKRESLTIRYTLDEATLAWHDNSERTRNLADKDLRITIRNAGFAVH